MVVSRVQNDGPQGTVDLGDLLASPDLRSLTVVAGDLDRIVRSVRLVQELAELRTLPQDGLAVVLPPASAQARGHQFDIALRETAATGAAAVVLTATAAGSVETTARRIATRHSLAVLCAPSTVEPTALVVAVSRALVGDAADALARIDMTRRHLVKVETAERGKLAAILAAASQALGGTVEVRNPDHAEPTAAIMVDGIADGFVSIRVPERPGSAWMIAAHTIAQLTADAYARAVGEIRRSQLAPIRDRGRLLGELLLAPESERAPLVARARSLAIPVDGWHQVLRFELSSSLNEPAIAVSTEQIEALARSALEAVLADSTETWYSTRIGGDPLLLRTMHTDPGPAAARTAHNAATIALAAARDRFPGLIIRCGIGAVHRRAEGLRTSATDARAALAATRQSRPPRDIVAIDALGMNQALIAWYASDATRQSVDEMLAPLAECGPETAEEYVRTLQAYLDHLNSPARAAKDLNVHPQTVNYRLRKITNLLHIDVNDTEQRLVLQLACRAWLMR